jgi:hypothetical protein
MSGLREAANALCAAAFALLLGACATSLQRVEPTAPAPGSVLQSFSADHALEDRVLALDPGHISAEDVHSTLAAMPAPQLILLHGGVYPVHIAMTSFAEFLISMGYPEKRIHRADRERDSPYSYSPYQESTELAGLIAWHYEHDGVRPLMIGHSQGGTQAVKVLYDLAGASGPEIAVWNPIIDAPEARTTIVDPLTGATRPVVGLAIPYVSAVGVGVAAVLMPNQWSMVARVRSIPDSVEDFTGFAIAIDLAAGTFPGARGISNFHANGKAKVRNVILPWWYSHVLVPVSADLATSEALRKWIDAYAPDKPDLAETLPEGPTGNIWWAADVWYSIKQHWCLEAQRLIRAQRAAGVNRPAL